jgi:hypothetical protein
MGFFSAINAGRAMAARGLMGAGTALRKFGDYGAPVIRKLGQAAGSKVLHAGIGLIGAGLAPVTGGASLGIAGALNKGLSMASGLAGKASDIAAGVGKFGERLQTAGQTIGGQPQTPQVYNARFR